MGGRGSGSRMSSSNSGGGEGFAPIKSNAVAYDGISNLPSRIGENQRWVLQRDYAVEGGRSHKLFEGKGTYGDYADHDIVALNAGFKSTAALKRAYKERTTGIGARVGDQAWTGEHDANGKMIWGKITRNKYRPVLVTLG